MSDKHSDQDAHPGAQPNEELGHYARRALAIEALLVEKGLIDRDNVTRMADELDAISPADGARVVARAWVDPEFKKHLLTEPKKTLAEMGYSLPFDEPEFEVIENTDQVHNMVVCTLCSCYPRALLGRPPDWYKSLVYRSRAVADPRGVLRGFGLELDDSIEVRVLDSTADLRYLVLPQRPEGTEGFNEEDLAKLVTRDSMIGVTKARSPETAQASYLQLLATQSKRLDLGSLRQDITHDDDVVRKQLVARDRETIQRQQARRALLPEVRVSGEQQHLRLHGRIADQGILQIAILPARRALDVEHLDLLIQHPDATRERVVLLEQFAAENRDTDRDAEFALALRSVLQAHELFRAIPGEREALRLHHLVLEEQVDIDAFAGKTLRDNRRIKGHEVAGQNHVADIDVDDADVLRRLGVPHADRQERNAPLVQLAGVGCLMRPIAGPPTLATP